MLHFAQTAIALVAAGASVLIVGGLVRETLHGDGRHLHLFPDAHDPPEEPVEKPADAAAPDPIPFPHSRGGHAHHDDRRRSRSDKGARQQGEQKQRRNKKHDRRKESASASSRTTAVESEDAESTN